MNINQRVKLINPDMDEQGVLIKKGFINGNFMYTVLLDNGKTVNVQSVKIINQQI